MRSRPYKPPPPIPLLDDIAAMIPRPKPTASPSNHIALDTLDHETSRLIPPKRRTHHVWVQGRLAAVRTVSTASLSSASRRDCGVSGTTARRHSLGSSGDDHDERETALREKQMRGYGIGGLGNIRRPTQVIHGSDSRRPAGRTDAPPLRDTECRAGPRPQKQKRTLRDLLTLTPAKA